MKGDSFSPSALGSKLIKLGHCGSWVWRATGSHSSAPHYASVCRVFLLTFWRERERRSRHRKRKWKRKKKTQLPAFRHFTIIWNGAKPHFNFFRLLPSRWHVFCRIQLRTHSPLYPCKYHASFSYTSRTSSSPLHPSSPVAVRERLTDVSEGVEEDSFNLTLDSTPVS